MNPKDNEKLLEEWSVSCNGREYILKRTTDHGSVQIVASYDEDQVFDIAFSL